MFCFGDITLIMGYCSWTLLRWCVIHGTDTPYHHTTFWIISNSEPHHAPAPQKELMGLTLPPSAKCSQDVWTVTREARTLGFSSRARRKDAGEELGVCWLIFAKITSRALEKYIYLCCCHCFSSFIEILLTYNICKVYNVMIWYTYIRLVNTSIHSRNYHLLWW